jgi:hypothetical protein
MEGKAMTHTPIDNTPSIDTPISKESLLMLGYREFPPNKAIDSSEAMFQKRIKDDKGTLYFVNFRRWKYNNHNSWDSQLFCDSDSGGYLWATIKEDTIEKTESRIRALWKANGGKRYD